MLVASAILATPLVTTAPAAAQAAAQAPAASRLSAAEAALAAAESQRLDAMVRGDVAALNQAIADDAIYIHANGVTQTKTDYLHDVEAGKSRYRSIEVNERSVRILGDVGLTNGVITLNVGVDRRIVAGFMGVYAKRDGQWRLLRWQSTPKTQPQTPAPSPSQQ
jgi:hypothetical protein